MALVRRPSPTDERQLSSVSLQRSSKSPASNRGVLQAQRRKLHELHREVRRVQNEGGSNWDRNSLDAYINRLSEQINSLDRELEMVADSCTRSQSPPPLGPVAQIAVQNTQMIIANSPVQSAGRSNSITIPMLSSPRQSITPQFVISASGVTTSVSTRGSIKATIDNNPRPISPPRSSRSVSPPIIRRSLRSPSPVTSRQENLLEPGSSPAPVSFARPMSPRLSRPNLACSGVTSPTTPASPLHPSGLNSQPNLSGLRTISSLSTPSSSAYPLPARASFPTQAVPLQSNVQSSLAWNTYLRSLQSLEKIGPDKVILGSSPTAGMIHSNGSATLGATKSFEGNGPAQIRLGPSVKAPAVHSNGSATLGATKSFEGNGPAQIRPGSLVKAPVVHSNGSAALEATKSFEGNGPAQIRPGSSVAVPMMPSSSFRPSPIGSGKVSSDIDNGSKQLSRCGSVAIPSDIVKSSKHETLGEKNGENDANDRTSFMSDRRNMAPLDESGDRKLSEEAVKLQRKLARIQGSGRKII